MAAEIYYGVNRSGQQTGRGHVTAGALSDPITGRMWELVGVVWGAGAKERAEEIAEALDQKDRESVGERPDRQCDSFSAGPLDLIHYWPSQQISQWGYDLDEVADQLMSLAKQHRLYPPPDRDQDRYCQYFERREARAMARQLIRSSHTHITQRRAELLAAAEEQ